MRWGLRRFGRAAAGRANSRRVSSTTRSSIGSARVERRGNPINNTGGYFSPQNGGSASAARYATLTYYDYQKDAQGTVSGDPTLQALLGLGAAQIDSLYTYVNGQLSAAGLTGFPNGLGDINGDGTGNGPAPGCRRRCTEATW